LNDTKICKDCKLEFDKDLISKRGLCPGCGQARQDRNTASIRSKTGEPYKKYKEGRDKALRRSKPFIDSAPEQDKS